ncbi:hypothetical protein [Aridibaculum aurantiacum]|uniref:hypothetical protein n=1 Tax=Aridibaculum aurantiacum TaxID=2810307 RepID=UPI001A956994|nr:hypothetical protein [Aridibaculum aurantiacum]
MKALVLAVVCLFSIPAFSQKTIAPEEVAKHIGDTVRVCGKIYSARYLETSNKQPTLLNMGDKFPKQHLTVVIYGEDRVKFGYKPEGTLIDKNICVIGKVEMYRDKPQIVVTDPFLIKLQ